METFANPDTETKACSACGIVKKLSEFSKDSRLKTGRQSRCLKCRCQKEKDRYTTRRKDNPSSYIANLAYRADILRTGFKPCSKCKLVKAVNEFYKAKNLKQSPSGRRSSCRECSLAYIAKTKQERRSKQIRKAHRGMSVNILNELLSAQKYQCVICSAVLGNTPSTSYQIDHWHGCRMGHSLKQTCEQCRRGIVCINCNRDIGSAERWLREGVIFPPDHRIMTYLHTYGGHLEPINDRSGIMHDLVRGGKQKVCETTATQTPSATNIAYLQ